MNNGLEPKVIEQLVVLFPALAAWSIVVMLAMIGSGVAFLARKFLMRLDVQDDTLRDIKNLLASEVGKLRELHHDIDRRVVRLESLQDAEGSKWGRRRDDHNGGSA